MEGDTITTNGDRVLKRVVIITGVSPLYALSEETAHSIAAEGNSTDLVLLGTAEDYVREVQSKFLAEFPHIAVLAHGVDITSSRSVYKAANYISSIIGVWDLFVHNATAHPFRCPGTKIREADENLWWDAFERNLRSLYNVSRHFFPRMANNATFINVIRADLDGGGVEHDSAGNASGLAAARVVEYLGEENEDSGLKVQNIIAMPEDVHVGDFISWAAKQRSAFVHAMTLNASAGIHGYAIVAGKLLARNTSEHDRSYNQSFGDEGNE